MKRALQKYTSGEEVANAVTHVVGSHLGAAMLALLVWQGAESGIDVAWKTTSAAIFGASTILLYAVSSAYHAVVHPPALHARMHVLPLEVASLLAHDLAPLCPRRDYLPLLLRLLVRNVETPQLTVRHSTPRARSSSTFCSVG